MRKMQAQAVSVKRMMMRSLLRESERDHEQERVIMKEK